MSAPQTFPTMAAPGAFLTEAAPDHAIPEDPMSPIASMRLVGEELAIEGIPGRNLAIFVTTWMEPEAGRVIDDNLHRTRREITIPVVVAQPASHLGGHDGMWGLGRRSDYPFRQPGGETRSS